MICLSLDLASRTGFAVDDGHGGVIFGVYDVKTTKESQDMGFFGYMVWLRTVIGARRPDLVMHESPIPVMPKGREGFTNFNTTKLACGLYGITKAVSIDMGVMVEEAHSSTIRKAVVGRGNAKKPEVIRHLRSMGHRVSDDNAADALAGWLYAKIVNGERRAA